jgi:hypothetical protein
VRGALAYPMHGEAFARLFCSIETFMMHALTPQNYRQGRLAQNGLQITHYLDRIMAIKKATAS